MFKRIFVPLVISIACALLLVGCGGSDTTNTTTTNTTAANKTATTTTTTTTTSSPATTTSSPATTSSTPATTTTASSGDKVGVPECDEYLSKYEACLSKVPAAARTQYEASFAQVRKSWREIASTPQGKSGLAQACKMATDSAKQSMKTYGCDF